MSKILYSDSMGDHKKALTIGILFVILLSFPILLFTLRSSQDTRQHADEVTVSDDTVATVGTDSIKEGDVKAIAGQSYDPSTLTSATLNKTRDLLIERKILDKTAKDLGISISNTEISAEASSGATTDERVDAKYLLLKDKITQAVTKNVKAYSIAFWVTSYDYPQKPEYDLQRADANKALDEIVTDFTSGQKISDIAATIYKKYPRLQGIMGVNGYIYTNKSDPTDTIFTQPKNIILKEKDADGTRLIDADNFKALSTIKTGEVKKVIRQDGSSGIVFDAVSVSSGTYTSYDDFLADKRKTLVKLYKKL